MGTTDGFAGTSDIPTTVLSPPSTVGIGLTLSRGLARRMGGELSYRREGGWTVFDLMLPWHDMPAAELGRGVFHVA